MDLLPRFDNKYFEIALFLTQIFGYVFLDPASKRLRNDTAPAKNVHSYTVRSNITSSHNPDNTSKLPKVELPIPAVERGGGRRKLEETKSTAARNCVLVFDIDDTICIHIRTNRDGTVKGLDSTWINTENNYTECPQIWYTCPEAFQEYYGPTILHTFLPHLHILFNYLIEHGARIVFYSSAFAERNLFLIPELLTRFWGNEKYEALKAKGQFAIHSEDDLDYRQRKNLRRVQRDGESLSDIILIDDCRHLHSIGLEDQQPYILARDLCTHHGGDVVLNSVYYLLGLFKTYFENKEYRNIPIRTAMAQIIPQDHPPLSIFGQSPHDSFVRDMIYKGLSAVQEFLPNATLYQRQGKYDVRRNITKLI